MLTPFDANHSDLGGPSSWSTNYGKSPEIIVASNGTSLDVLAQDYDSATAWQAVLLHIEPNGAGYQITQALMDMPMLDRVMGLAVDAAGNRYYATGVDEAARSIPAIRPWIPTAAISCGSSSWTRPGRSYSTSIWILPATTSMPALR